MRNVVPILAPSMHFARCPPVVLVRPGLPNATKADKGMLKTTIIVASVCISFGGFFHPAIAADLQTDSSVTGDQNGQDSSVSQPPPDDERAAEPSVLDPTSDPQPYAQPLDGGIGGSTHAAAPAIGDEGLSDNPLDNATTGGHQRARARSMARTVSVRINPDDYVSVRQISPSLLDGTEVQVASGASVGRVNKVVVGRDGSVSAVRLKLANRRCVTTRATASC
jgi:hypothetical protein